MEPNKPLSRFCVLVYIVSMVGAAASAQPAEPAPDPKAGSVDQVAADSPLDLDRLQWHLADIDVARDRSIEALAVAKRDGARSKIVYHTRLLERLDAVRRPDRMSLSLEEAIRMTLANSYAIQTQHYNPAIEATRVVEAQAAFDAVFFGDVSNNKVDRPSGSELFATGLTALTSSVGIRKLLPTGSLVSATYGLNRTETNLSFQQLNPEYFSNLALELRQPLLRGFGLDVNLSQTVVAKNNRAISDLAFERQVRDTIRQVEELYWRLVQARHEVVITSVTLVDFLEVYDSLDARKDFDVTLVQLTATRARLERSKAAFVTVVANVRDAEDRLIAAMNTPKVNLADDVEIVPLEKPLPKRVVVDRLAEVQTALDHRREVKEQKLRVASAKVGLGAAKNAELPKLDLLFRYTVDGIGTNADASFNLVTSNRFTEYLVGLQLEVPIGNRGARAAQRRANLQYNQAVSALKGQIEQVILEVNLAIRRMTTTYDQIAPNFASVEATEEEVRSVVARAERQDYSTLTSELGARESLGASRRTLLSALIDANLALVDLELTKGTLLQYYGVSIAPTDDR